MKYVVGNVGKVGKSAEKSDGGILLRLLLLWTRLVKCINKLRAESFSCHIQTPLEITWPQ